MTKDTRTKRNQGDIAQEELRKSPMMANLLDGLAEGVDIGEYGRLTFVMVARHFLSTEHMVSLLADQPYFGEKEARALILQVNQRDYNPPKRERVLEWQSRQEFQICPNPEDPGGCNVYNELDLPEHIYQQINEFWEERANNAPLQ
jgi:hypothetical protein